MTAPVGATAADWLHFDQVLGLGADLLPVVPDPNARAAPYSAVSKFGKIPSVYDQEDQAHGLKEWQTREITPAAMKHWSADRRYSMCVRASAARAIDVDIDSNVRAEDVLQTICDTLIDMGAPCLPMRRRANSAKFLMPFRLAGTWKKRRIIVNKEPLQAIEFLGDGQQWVAAGSHPSGALYEWRNGLPPDIPTLTAPQFEELWRTLNERFALDPKLSTATPDEPPDQDSQSTELLTSIDPDTLQRVKAALQWPALLERAADNSFWSEVGYALLSLKRQGFELWSDFCRRAPSYEPGDETKWWSAHELQQVRSDYRHIFTLARGLGWANVSQGSDFGPVVPAGNLLVGDAPPPLSVDKVPLAQARCTDQANVNRLHTQFGDRLISIGDMFYWYDGKHWKRDEAQANRCVMTLSAIVKEEAKVAREKLKTMIEGNELAAQVKDLKRPERSAALAALLQSEGGEDIWDMMQLVEALEKWSVQCEMGERQNKARQMLRSAVAVDAGLMDRHAHLFNCQNGTINLRTGELKPHDAKDYITHCAPVEYHPNAECPRFRAFLSEVLDTQRATFLQRWFGYCITGETREQKLVLHVGPGSNGKGTLFRVLQSVLGGYVHTASPNLLMGSNERHPTEIADLFGKRLVVSHESEDGAQLREGFVKQATGEDTLSGRYLYKDFFTFQPTFKLQLLTNYKPIIKGQNHAIWRRILIVWYEHRYGSAEQVAAGQATRIGDPTLPDRLIEECEGILAWLVHGAREWYQNTLDPPSSVLEASLAYQKEQDRVAEFISDRCILDTGAWAPYTGAFGGLYNAYTQWCRDCGYTALGLQRFVDRLEHLVPGFKAEKQRRQVDGVSKQMRGCRGIRVNIDGDGGGSRSDSAPSAAPGGIGDLV